MNASFTDLVGTAVVPAHCFDSTELTDLTPALATKPDFPTLTAGGPMFCPYVTDVQDIAHQASEASPSMMAVGITCVSDAHADLAHQASESFPTLHTGCPGWG